MEKNIEGTRIRQSDMSFDPSGKAKGGELVLKLDFQIMEDKGVGIYNQGDNSKSSRGKDSSASPFARRLSKASFSFTSPRITSKFEASTPSRIAAAAELHGIDDLNLDEPARTPVPIPSTIAPFQKTKSKASFSVTSPRITNKFEASTPSQTAAAAELQGIDDLNLDEPAPAPVPIPSTIASVQKPEPEAKMEDLDIPDFDVVDKGIELEDKGSATEAELDDEVMDERSVSCEVVKEVVHDPVHLTRLTELDSIAQQIKALESMISHEDVKTEQEREFHRLDAEEETVTREFLQLLEEEELNLDVPDVPPLKLDGMEELEEAEAKGFLPDLGKGLGSVVQTRDGGYLVAMNPFETEVLRKEMPRIAMQISKPLIIPLENSASGFEVFQKIAPMGVEELASKVLSATGMDELIGKTA
ncbi:hypothetical protein AAC387_Pa08g2278 [Persea americana]